MEYLVLLSESGFPNLLNNIDCSQDGVVDQNQREQLLLDCLNNYNKHINVSKIEYSTIKEQFPVFQEGRYTGAIIKQQEISVENQEQWIDEGYSIVERAEKIYARRIVIYLFFTSSTEGGRNVMISQNIFPELIEYMKTYLDSPSNTIANHPIYFVNIVRRKITANSIVKRLAGLKSMGVNYLELFDGTLDVDSIPKDIVDFARIYYGHNNGSNELDEVNYKIDFINKRVSLKANKLFEGEYLKRKQNGELEFRGSQEKFYWMDILTVITLALNSNYSLDISEYERFCENENAFSDDDDKFRRCKILLDYIKKVM